MCDDAQQLNTRHYTAHCIGNTIIALDLFHIVGIPVVLALADSHNFSDCVLIANCFEYVYGFSDDALEDYAQQNDTVTRHTFGINIIHLPKRFVRLCALNM